MDELRTILAGRTFCGWMGVPVLGIKWESSCEGVSVNGELVGGPVGTDWSRAWRFIARLGARGDSGRFSLRLRN